jgi:low affinity Fe/Cu permease
VKRDPFPRFARWVSRTVGHTSAFITSLAIVLTWAITGPYFHFSDTWQLVINTGTDSEAMHVKLDEIICAIRGAHNDLLDIEELTEAELDVLRAHYTDLAVTARKRNGTHRA